MASKFFKRLIRLKNRRHVKRVSNFIGGLLGMLFCLFGAYLTYKTGWADLSEVDAFKSVVIEKGVTSNKTSTGGRNKVTLTK